MDKVTHEVRMENWKSVIEQCSSRPEGMTVRAWLEEQGISEKTYYYWQRKVRQAAYEQMQRAALPTVAGETGVAFAEISVPQEPDAETEKAPAFRPAAVIRAGSYSVEFSNSASATLVKKILEVVDHAG